MGIVVCVCVLGGGTCMTFLVSLLCCQGFKKLELLVHDLTLAQVVGNDISKLGGGGNSCDFSGITLVFSGH